jgi:endonuclease/exonuclease/phosphatase family metal-dependent hydrolase
VPLRWQGVRGVRIVSLNLWNVKSDWPSRMRVAAAGIAALQPDVVAMQEVVATAEHGNQASQIAAAVGGELLFDVVDDRATAGKIGNAIITRCPVKQRGSILLPGPSDDPRRVMYAELEHPAGSLPFFNCHLSWEMWHAPRREAQVVALDEYVRSHPASLPPIICGDFNTPPDSAAILFMTGRMGLASRGTYYRDAWARRHPHEDGDTWSDRNPHAVRWIERNRRLDYIFIGQIRADGWGAILDCRVVLDMPGPDGIWASDHFALFAEIGIASKVEEAV